MNNPYVILGLAALSFALGQSGPLIMRRPGVLRFAWGLLLHAALFISERGIWALFAWLLGTAATDFVASFGDLFIIIGMGSLPLLFAAIAFAPHLGAPFMGIFYVISLLDVVGRASAQFALRPVATALWLGISWLAALLAEGGVKRVVRELSARTQLDPLRDVRPYTTEEILAAMPGVQSHTDRKASLQQ